LCELLGAERVFWGGVAYSFAAFGIDLPRLLLEPRRGGMREIFSTLVLKPGQKPGHGDAQLKREKSRDD